jgi:hypothetical protein
MSVHWRGPTVMAGAALLFAAGAVATAGVANAAPVVDTFTCTGGEQTWTVPAGVTQATFVVEGASGSVLALAGSPPGLGGRAAATVAVTPGAIYTVVAGCAGGNRPSPGIPVKGGFGFGRGGDGGVFTRADSLPGGAGGGGSSVLLGADVVLVGGGGGGPGDGSAAGAGGGTTGGSGNPTNSDPGGGGGGGTATGPGVGGRTITGTTGSSGTGHDGGSGAATAVTDNGGGGGGGGWFGGGGGASGDLAIGSGGGGSGYAAPGLSATLDAGVRSGDGQVTVSYDAG